MKHFISIADLTRDEALSVLATAEHMAETQSRAIPRAHPRPRPPHAGAVRATAPRGLGPRPGRRALRTRRARVGPAVAPLSPEPAPRAPPRRGAAPRRPRARLLGPHVRHRIQCS